MIKALIRRDLIAPSIAETFSLPAAIPYISCLLLQFNRVLATRLFNSQSKITPSLSKIQPITSPTAPKSTSYLPSDWTINPSFTKGESSPTLPMPQKVTSALPASAKFFILCYNQDMYVKIQNDTYFLSI